MLSVFIAAILCSTQCLAAASFSCKSGLDGSSLNGTAEGAAHLCDITTRPARPPSAVAVTPSPTPAEWDNGIRICPRLRGKPGARLSAASDLTFGCAPGLLCDPPKPDGCNLWPGPPDDAYMCHPDHCIEAPKIELSSRPAGKGELYSFSGSYFNLDPHDFGLTYSIFTHKLDQRQTSSIHRRDALPSICFDDCNAAQLIALSTGKTGSLCNADSAFQSAYEGCTECARDNRPRSSRGNTTEPYEPPAFAQFVRFCQRMSIVTTTIVGATPSLPSAGQSPAFAMATPIDLNHTAGLAQNGAEETATKEGPEKEMPSLATPDKILSTASRANTFRYLLCFLPWTMVIYA